MDKENNNQTHIDNPTKQTGIEQRKIVEEVRKSFLEYSMSVIVARALPDVRDGLKPVHRRILYGMSELGITASSQHKKSARIVGEVMGKFHPHGDASIYDAMVRLAQNFAIRCPLVDGQGNFGSIDGDPAGAMRYTEARLSRIAMEMLADLDKDTVDFMPNFDETLKEPTVLPAKFPNLLVNGSQGIAVGMATNIPPHNLGDVIDAAVAYIDNREISIRELTRIIKGPDFPTGAIITGSSEIEQAYQTGKGRIVIRSKAEIEEKANGKSVIHITEIPYNVNKAEMIKNIANHVKDGKIVGISDIRDESDMDGLSIVIECKRDANANVVLNKLYTYTELQSTFNVNMLALVNGEPKVLTLKDALHYYIMHRKEVVVRRCQFELNKAQARAHILEGLLKALDIIDQIIATIRGSKTAAEAKQSLIDLYEFTEKQAQAILDMRLQQLTNLERSKLEDEYNALAETIANLNAILASDEKQFAVIREELLSVKEKYNTPRKTQIDYNMDVINYEDLIQQRDIVVCMTQKGYIKRMGLDLYKAQNKGGRGVKGVVTRDDDYIKDVIATTTHSRILFFTNYGRVYSLSGYDIPEGGKTAKGSAVINLIQLQPGEKVQHFMSLEKETAEKYIIFATKQGYVKRMELNEIQRIRSNGLIAIYLEEGDELISVALTSGEDDVILVTKEGKAIRFSEEELRPMGRTARGVRGIKFRPQDELVDMACVRGSGDIFCIAEHGFGKRTANADYRKQSRGGMGLIAMKVTEKTGKIVAARIVGDDDDVIIMNSSGIMIRTSLAQLNSISRATQGVKLMNLKDGESVVSVTIVPHEEPEEESGEEDIAPANETSQEQVSEAQEEQNPPTES